MKLNPEKCTFGVTSGKFLGFLITQRGIEVNPEKIEAINNMPSPKNLKEVQILAGRVVALSRFVSKLGDRCLPFFKVLRKVNCEEFQWTEQCEEAFLNLKAYLSNPPILSRPREGEELMLYLSTTQGAVSSVLVRTEEGKHLPIYYASKVLNGPETRYRDIEKLVLALVMTVRKLRPYFQSHTV